MTPGSRAPSDSRPNPNPWPSPRAPSTLRKRPLPRVVGCRGRNQMAEKPWSTDTVQADIPSTEPFQLGTPTQFRGDEAGLP